MGVWWRVPSVLRGRTRNCAGMAGCRTPPVFCLRRYVKSYSVQINSAQQIDKGPFPELKFPTIISRMTENQIKPSLLFFRTSAVSRSKPKFLRESSMLPPRAYTTCIQTLRHLREQLTENDVLELHFADEEGDPYAVELAARLGGYVVGKDSDFVILNAEGYLGYVPFDEMIWSMDSAEQASALGDDWSNDDGFQTVINSKSKKKAATQRNIGQGIIPPERTNDDTLGLSVLLYSPSDLAAHLQIPLSLLPLLAALVGNDFTGMRQDTASATTSPLTNLQWLFFERQLTLSQRITRVATTLRDILDAAFAASSGKKIKGRDRAPVHSVMELIDRAVTSLVVRNLDSMASGEKERVVERVVEATLQYAIQKYEGEPGQLWTSEFCPLHELGACPLVLLRLPPEDNQSSITPSVTSQPTSPVGPTTSDRLDRPGRQLSPGQALYVSAYRSGYLDPHTLDVLHSGTFWYRQFLENPDLEAVARTFARPIQLWTYAILDEVFGIPEQVVAAEETEEEPSQEEEEGEETEDEDELVDVIEETDEDEGDPLAPLRGALQQLNGSSSHLKSSQDDGASLTSSQRDVAFAQVQKPRKLVEEHLRKGTRLAAEDVEVPSLLEVLGRATGGSSDATSPILLSLDARLLLLLRALGHSQEQASSILPFVMSLSPEQRIPALTLRWVLSRIRLRAQESGGNKEREKEKWSKSEAQAFLAAFNWHSSGRYEDEDVPEVPIVDRNVQLTAQTLCTMDAIERLSESLLLASSGEQEQGAALLPSPSLLFSGRRFHAYLTGTLRTPTNVWLEDLWQAACEGLEDVFSDIGKNKRKKGKAAPGDSIETSPSTPVRGIKRPNGTGSLVGGGKFGLLASMSLDE